MFNVSMCGLLQASIVAWQPLPEVGIFFAHFLRISFIFCAFYRCSWPVCERTCAGLNDNQMHGLECRILSTRPGPHPSSPVNVLTSFYRKDALLVLRCLLLQMKYPERWNKVMLFESHDEKRIGTKYYT